MSKTQIFFRAILVKLPNPVEIFKKHLRGEYSLARAFWLHYVLLTELFFVPIMFFLWVDVQINNPEMIWPMAVFLTVCWTAIITACIGTWRSAKHYVVSGGKPIWGMMARAFIVILLVFRTVPILFD